MQILLITLNSIRTEDGKHPAPQAWVIRQAQLSTGLNLPSLLFLPLAPWTAFTSSKLPSWVLFHTWLTLKPSLGHDLMSRCFLREAFTEPPTQIIVLPRHSSSLQLTRVYNFYIAISFRALFQRLIWGSEAEPALSKWGLRVDFPHYKKKQIWNMGGGWVVVAPSLAHTESFLGPLLLQYLLNSHWLQACCPLVIPAFKRLRHEDLDRPVRKTSLNNKGKKKKKLNPPPLLQILFPSFLFPLSIWYFVMYYMFIRHCTYCLPSH